MRGLKDRLVEELTTGKLAWLLEEVRNNYALSLGICENYLAVYYRGALACTVKPGGGYTFLLDEAHFISPEMKDEYAIFMRDKKAVGVYQRKFPILMQAMDEAEAQGKLNVLFPQEVACDSGCVLDPAYPVGHEMVMLSVVKGQLLAVKHVIDPSINLSMQAAFSGVDMSELVGSAKAQMANLVALGLLSEEVPMSSTAELVFLCSPEHKAKMTGKTLVLEEGSNVLEDGFLI